MLSIYIEFLVVSVVAAEIVALATASVIAAPLAAAAVAVAAGGLDASRVGLLTASASADPTIPSFAIGFASDSISLITSMGLAKDCTVILATDANGTV